VAEAASLPETRLGRGIVPMPLADLLFALVDI